MRAFVVAFFLAAASSAALTPLIRLLAIRLGAVSRPGGRNVNDRPVPRLGGIAIALAFVVPLVTVLPADSVVAAGLRSDWRRLVGLLAGATLLAAVGVLDDTRRVRPIHKLVVQTAAASIAYASGFRIDAVQLPLLNALSMGAFAWPVTVLWIVGIVNAVNLIDGLDGLAAGVVFFAGLTNFVVAQVNHDIFVGAVMATTLGAVLGFLFFNFNPARIFMGDSGSYFLGFVLGTTSVVGASQQATTVVSMLVPVLALGLPIFDTLFTIARRYLERRPIFSPDRGHIHHRLLDMGLTQRRAVLLLYGVSVVFTVAAIATCLGRRWQVGLAVLTASVVVIGLVRFVGYFEYLFLIRRQRARLRSPETEALRRILPEAVSLFAAAASGDAVWQALQLVLERSGVARAELVRVGGQTQLRAWDGAQDEHDKDWVSARFPLGEERLARADLRFRWHSPSGDVTPQVEVLLQVLADVVAGALLRVNSPLAPRAVAQLSEPERVSSGQPLHAEP